MSSKVFKGVQIRPGITRAVDDRLPVEAILQIKVNGLAYTTTVRTPGADEELARGLLYTEGMLADPAVALGFRAVEDPDTGLTGCLEITVPQSALAKDIAGRRSAMGSASCGLCGLRDPAELALAGTPLEWAVILNLKETRELLENTGN